MTSISSGDDGTASAYLYADPTTVGQPTAEETTAIFTTWFTSTIGPMGLGNLAFSRETAPQTASLPRLIVPQNVTIPNSTNLFSEAVSPPPEKLFYPLFFKQVEELAGKSLQALADEMGGMTQEQLQQTLLFGLKIEGNYGSPYLRQLAKQAKAAAEQQIGTNWSMTFDPKEFIADLQAAQNKKFSSLLKNEIADPSEQGAIEYAYYTPAAAQTLTPQQQALLSKLREKVATYLQTVYGVPRDFSVPIDSTSYNFRLSNSYGENYLDGLNKLLEEGKISTTDFNKLRTLFYMPTTTFSNSNELQPIYEQLTEQAQQALIEEYNLPAQFQPSVSTLSFDNHNNGVWRDTFAQNLQSYSPPLTQAQKAAIKAALADPSSATDETLALLEQIVGTTTAQVRSALQLPANWEPTETTAPSINTLEFRYLKNQDAVLRDTLKAAIQTAGQLPPNDPDRQALFDYFKIVGRALNALQEMLYTIESKNAEVSKRESAILLEAQKNKLEKERKEIEKRYEKPKGGLFGKIIALFTSIFLTILTAGAAAPLAHFMLMSTISDMAGGTNFYEKAIEKVNKVIEDLTGSDALSGLIKLAIYMVVILYTGYAQGGILSVYLMMDLLEKMHFVSDFVKAAGGDEQAQMIANLVVTMVLMITITAVSIVATAGVDTAAVLAGIAQKVADITSRIASAFPRLTSAVGRIASVTDDLSTIASDLTTAARNAAGSAGQRLREAAQAARNTAQDARLCHQAANETRGILTRLNSAAARLEQIIATRATTPFGGQAVEAAGAQLDEALATAENAMEVIERAATQIEEGLTLIARGTAEWNDDLVIQGQRMVNTARTMAGQAQSAAIEAEHTVNRALTQIETVLEKSLERIEKWVHRANAFAQIAQATASSSYQFSQAAIYLEMAEMARAIGRLKADIETIDALIKMLKKLISELIEELQPLGDLIKSLNATKEYQYEKQGVPI